MGRKKIKKSQKKAKLSITIASENVCNIHEHGIKNKSKFINSLLRDYFEIKDEKPFDTIEMIYNQEFVSAEAMNKFNQ